MTSGDQTKGVPTLAQEARPGMMEIVVEIEPELSHVQKPLPGVS